MKKISTLLMCICLLLMMQSHIQAQTYQLVWSDEFNGSIGPDWVFETGTGSGGWGNNELEYYRQENATIQNNALVITAKREAFGGMNYTSARMKTQGRKSWKYGRIEARMSMPAFQGIWPAFWTLGENISSVAWPACGEIDIMEHINTGGEVRGTIHWADQNNVYAYYGGGTTTSITSMHTYSIEWTPESIKWFVDGVQYHEANIANNINGTNEFHNNFFILFNLAVGGNWPGFTIDNNGFPATMVVDYVRVYQLGTISSAPVVSSSGTASGSLGTTFNYTITASNSPTSYGAIGLPPGLSVNTSTGVITGTPTALGTYNTTVTATNAIGTGSKTVTITIGNPPPCAAPYINLTSTAPAIDTSIDAIWSNATVGSINNVTLGARPADFTGSQWRALYDNTNLYVLVEVKDASRFNDSGTSWWEDDVVEIFIDGNNSKGTSYDGVNDFQYGFRYNDAAIKIGGSSVNRTAGVTFTQHNVTNGYNIEVRIPWSTIGITPVAGNKIGFDVSVDDDDNGGVRDAQMTAFATTGVGYTNPSVFGSVTLCSGTSTPAPVVSNTSLPTGTAGTAYSTTITASNNPTSFGATGLPAGLSVNTSSGIISGTPAASGTFTITLSATNATGTGTKQLSLVVNPAGAAPVVSNTSLPTGTVGTAYNTTIAASNNPTSFNATGLPAGLSVNTSSGVISGTPTASGTFTVTLSATNATGTGTKQLSLVVNPAGAAPVVSNTSLPTGTVGTAYNTTITATNNPTSRNATGLPAGLSVNTSTGVISGTPTASGTFTVTLSATNASGTGSKQLSLVINPAGDPPGTVTCLRTSGTITVNGTLSEGNWNSVINKSITKSISGSPNNTATFGVLWDNTNLYVGVRILDANLNSDSPNTWDDDAVEVYIDANNNKLTTYDGRDNQIIKNYNKTTVFTKLAITGLQHAWAAITGGYSVELAIPWSQLGIAAPAAGQNYGFDVGYDDDDNAGARDHQAAWNGTINNYQNTSAFGTLTLSGTAAARAVAPEITNTESVKVVYWPNPVDQEINITTDGSYETLEVMDILGKSIHRDKTIFGKTNIKVDMSSAVPGVHLIRLSGKSKSELIRVIKK